MSKAKKWDRGLWLLQKQRLHIADPCPPPEGGPIEIGEVVSSVIRQAGMENVLWHTRVESVWAEVVGETLAKRTRPGGVEGATLLVYVRHSVFLCELVRDRSVGARLLENLRARLPGVPYCAVRFVMDPGDRHEP